MKITRLLLFEILVATMVIFISCRKTDQNPVDQEKPITQTAATAKFFTISTGTNANVKAIAQIISKQNAKKRVCNWPY